MSKQTKALELVDLLNCAIDSEISEYQVIEYLRWLTYHGEVSTTAAWSFFSTGGKIPDLQQKPKDTTEQQRQKSRTLKFLSKISGGNEKCLKILKTKVKTYLIQKSGGFCCYCRRQLYLHGSAINIDHIFPKTPDSNNESDHQTGRRLCFSLENMAVCCIDCNTAKTNKKHIFNPNKHNYSDYIKYNISITNEMGMISYTLTENKDKYDAAFGIYDTFKLKRLECRKIMAFLGNDSHIQKLEACIIASDYIGDLCDEIRNFYDLTMNDHANNLG